MSENIEYYIEHCRNCGHKLGINSYNIDECYECYAPFSKEQRLYASHNPAIYERKITLPDGSSKMLIEQAEYMNMTGKILEVFGVFAITNKGIECLTHEYLIERSRFDSLDWSAHMAEKSWVNMGDFEDALKWAKANIQSLSL